MQVSTLVVVVDKLLNLKGKRRNTKNVMKRTREPCLSWQIEENKGYLFYSFQLCFLNTIENKLIYQGP